MADKKFRDAMRPLGASKIRVMRLAGLSLILPSYIADTLCILDLFATVCLFDKISTRIPARLIA